MKLLVSDDMHLLRTPDGKHWCTAIYGYDFWLRYLDVFESVRIVGRMKDVDKQPAGAKRVDGDGVEIYGIPFFQGPKQLAKKYIQIQASLRHAYKGVDAALYRMPSPTSQLVYRHKPRNMAFAGEIVYDPHDDAQKQGEGLFLHAIHAIISNQLRNFCMTANGVSYVTENAIQEHYPSFARKYGQDNNHFDSHYSTITLCDEVFTEPREFPLIQNQAILAMSSVSMNSERKGERVILSALKLVKERGYSISAIFIGDGQLRHSFEEYAQKLGVSDNVTFTGLLPSSTEVMATLKGADIYIFPTQGEGLPRGVLEAMAVGMPVLATPVGGLPEIIERKYLFDPMNAREFADAICRLIDNPSELAAMSRRNFSRALEYKNSILQPRRILFYNQLRKCAKQQSEKTTLVC